LETGVSRWYRIGAPSPYNIPDGFERKSEMDPEMKERIRAESTWTRALWIVIFAILYNIAEIVVVAVVVFQFLSTLFAGKTNERLLRFGRQLTEYMRQILAFVTYNSDDKAFPVGEWPNGEAPMAAAPKKKAARKKEAPDDDIEGA
jgi:hypothetical protein